MSATKKERLEIIPMNREPLEPPEPLVTLVNYSEHPGGCTTAVTRVHPPEVGYCGLCPREECNATMGVCLVGVQEFIPVEEAWRLSTNGRPRLGLPAAAKDLSRSG